MPKVKEPLQLQNIAVDTIGDYVFTVCLRVLESKGKFIINTKALHRYLFSDLPSDLCCRVASRVLLIANSVVNRLNTCMKLLDESEDTHTKDTIRNAIVSGLCPHVSTLDMSRFHIFVKRTLCENLNMLLKLRTLVMAAPFPDKLENFAHNLSLLKFLVVFRMRRCCNDATVRVLAIHCNQTLRILDISGSRKVSDESVINLTKLNKLNEILVAATSITNDGISKLFSNLKQYRDKNFQGFTKLSLGNESTWPVPTSDLINIVKICPKLIELELIGLTGNLGILGQLCELQDLKLRFCDYYGNNMQDLLNSKNQRLSSLYLINVINVDLVSIVTSCVHLRKLFLWNCSTCYIASGNIDNACIVFQNIKILDLFNVCSAKILEHILSVCINIEEIVLASYDDITDDQFSRIMSKNPLRKLKELTVISVNSLSMITVKALVAHCPVLERLQFLDKWKGVTASELEHFKREMECSNKEICFPLLKQIGMEVPLQSIHSLHSNYLD